MTQSATKSAPAAAKNSAVSDSRITGLDDVSDDISAKPVVVEEAVHEVKSADDQMSGDKVKLMVHHGQGDGGTDAVFISINGYAYQIPRGKPVSVPVEVHEVLKCSVQTIYMPRADGSNVAQEIPRFAYNLL